MRSRSRVVLLVVCVLAAGCSKGGESTPNRELPRPPLENSDGRSPAEQTVPGQLPSAPGTNGGDGPDGGGSGAAAGDDVSEVVDALARFPDSTFSVSYKVTGAVWFDASTIGWNSPWERWDAVIYGSDVTAYRNASNGKLTVCVSVGPASDCDTAQGDLKGQPYQALTSMDPEQWTDAFAAEIQVPGATVTHSTIAGRKAVCAKDQTYSFCIDIKTGAVLKFAPGTVASFPEIGATAKSFRTPVSKGEVSP